MEGREVICAGYGIDRRAVPVPLTRNATGAFNADGEWTAGAPATTTIKAVVQPTTGRQLMDVPEGIRTEAKWLAWSRSEIRDEDVIAYAGLSYRVLYVWPRAEGSFYRAAMGELKP